MASKKILGIDFGTTNSAFAVMEGGDPEIIVNSEGDRTTPSVVGFTDDGERLVGKSAKNQAVQNPERTVESIKRHMGEEEYTVEIDDEAYTPEQISAMILQKIKRDAEEYLGDEVQKAVITVPAYFSDRQRQATKDAGEIAGFEVDRIVNEPTAASMAYGLDEDQDRAVLVYDLGGGTFSVAILDLGGGIYEVVATNGDNALGGDDWDQAIIDHVADEFENENGIDLREDRQTLQRLTEAAEEAKIELSSRKQTTINLPFITATDSGPIHLEHELARATFESLTEDLVERTVGPTEQALDDAGYTKDDIDEVLLVGGGTRMPMIQDKVEEMTGKEPKKNVNPDEAVALGAAIQGGVLSGEVDDLVLLDVTPLSLGIEVKGGLFERLIEKNTTVPTEESKIFTTAADNQTSVRVRVFQGEREIAKENELLGEVQLTGIPPASAGPPQIEVTFSIDENGIVNVSAEDKGSGNREEITTEGGADLPNEEIDRERGDLTLPILFSAESGVQRAERLLEENEDSVDDDIRESVEDAIADVESLLGDDEADREEIEDATERLLNQIQETEKNIYRQSTQSKGESSGAGADDRSSTHGGPSTQSLPSPSQVLDQDAVELLIQVREDLKRAADTSISMTSEIIDGLEIIDTKLSEFISELSADPVHESVENQVVDPLEEARKLISRAADTSTDTTTTRSGIWTAIRRIEEVLETVDVEIIDPERGSATDPLHHQVVGKKSSELEAGQILTVNQSGYRRGDSVPRPARVTISSGATQRRPETIPTAPSIEISYDDLEVGGIIERGGNADVHHASVSFDETRHTVALKRPSIGGAVHEDIVDRLVEGTRTWASLDDHDHIVGVVDFGTQPVAWIAMEYMDGGHLRERSGEMELPQALWTALTVTKGVRHAHRRGVAHLDLKPENVLFRTVEDAWDVPKVADWGLSKCLVEHSKDIEGFTPEYAAPEQFEEGYESADEMTDIYQLGAVFYELFTGSPPFDGHPFEVMNQIKNTQPTPPSETAKVPPELDEILLTALAKEKGDRYDDIVYLRDDLEELFDDL